MSLLLDILDQLYGTGIAIFPVLGFVFQYLLIRRRQSIGSFSIKVCGILLLSNILKISFFIYRSFSMALLFQALLMITVQLLLLQLCIRIMQTEGHFEFRSGAQESSQDSQWMWLKSFWRWQNLSSYMALTSFCLAVLISHFQIEVLGEGIGYLAMLFDTCLLLPQLIQNLKQNRVKGVSYLFVALNASQDMFELSFVIVKDQPFQYVLVNSIQLLADFALISQIVYYKCLRKTASSDQLNEVIEDSASNTDKVGQSANAKEEAKAVINMDQQIVNEYREAANKSEKGNQSDYQLESIENSNTSAMEEAAEDPNPPGASFVSQQMGSPDRQVEPAIEEQEGIEASIAQQRQD